ncbi:hypothetical protein, partial [Bacillus sp. Marseille-Q3570]|uniref:hypothetical protein n=1 Tax=Bacillus sp. Marseille-Q3570 TaxID=2963522 RepID=UPI0021B7CA91
KIKELLTERNHLLEAMREYVIENKTDRFAVTNKIFTWLKAENDEQTIEYLLETGFITYETAPKIYERGFLGMFMNDINFIFADSEIEIIDLDDSINSYIIKPFVNRNFKISCSYKNFIHYFGWVLFGAKRFVAFEVKNILKVSTIYDNPSLDLAFDELRKVSRSPGSQFNLRREQYSGDGFALNTIDIYDKKRKKVWVLNNKRKFLNKFKTYAFEVEDFSNDEFEYYLTNLSPSEFDLYTDEELKDLREVSKEMDQIKKR